MKSKLLLIILSFSVCIYSCKKEKSPEDQLANAKKQVIGSWLAQSAITTYYDAQGKVVDTHAEETGNNTLFQLDGTTLKTSNSSTDNFEYTLGNVDGKISIHVIGNSYNLSFDNNIMTWSLEQQHQNQAYTKSVYIIKFKRQ